MYRLRCWISAAAGSVVLHDQVGPWISATVKSVALLYRLRRWMIRKR